MESSPGFQIIFIFTQDSGEPGLAGSLALSGNSFVLDGSTPQQVLPYSTTATPALASLTVEPQSFTFRGVADTSTLQQSLELATKVTANGETLEVTVNNVGSATIRYQFPGYPNNSGSLSLGPNSIPFP